MTLFCYICKEPVFNKVTFTVHVLEDTFNVTGLGKGRIPEEHKLTASQVMVDNSVYSRSQQEGFK